MHFFKDEADLLVKLAEAEKVRLKNEALKDVGSERMVGLKMANVYKGLNMIVLPVSEGGMNLKTTDINRLIGTMGIKAMPGKGKQVALGAAQK